MRGNYFFGYAVAVMALSLLQTRADSPTVPGDGFAASRYSDLWTHSPFSVATPEAAPDSPDYSLYGIARFNGIYYASIVDKKSQDHFLLTSDKPVKGFTLVSVTQGHSSSDSQAIVTKDGQSLTLKLELPTAGPPVPNMAPGPNNAAMQQRIAVPGMIMQPTPPGFPGARQTPPPAVSRRAIHVPPPPPSATQAPAPPPPP